MIRNFAIIAHIDAGKSTLADRLLEITHTVDPRQMRQQLLDTNPIERERGITIKMAPVTMKLHWTTAQGKFRLLSFPSPKLDSKTTSLNLIDTPGHVDFHYEVERALQACEGAILLLDATKGVQAQTVANYHLAKNLNLKIIPAINKIDSPLADIPSCSKQINQLTNTTSQPLCLSAKTNQNIPQLLEQIITQIPPPPLPFTSQLKALVFNSIYHSHLGVIAFIRIFSGCLKIHDSLCFLSSAQNFTAQEIGIFSPQRQAQTKLETGTVGYIITGLKHLRQVQIGDTITHSASSSKINPLPGFRPIKPNLYFNLFPVDNSRFKDLLDALAKLKLNDASLTTKITNSPLLGQGLQIGFLGLLHAEVVSERLEREFDLPVITASPSVEYQAVLRSGKTVFFTSPNDFPDPATISTTKEPLAKVSLVTPPAYQGRLIQVCQDLRGQPISLSYLDQLVKLEYTIPLIEVITSLHQQTKSASSGFASIDYQVSTWQETKLVKLEVLLNHQAIPPLAIIVPQSKAQTQAKTLAKRLQAAIPRQQFEIPIQVTLNNQIIARQTVRPFRKDVTAKLYGGDRTRRMKLLEKQKKGKARLKKIGQINLPQAVFLAAIKTQH